MIKVPCECLDFVEALHKDKVYPVMYCHMKLKGHFDIDRLKKAIWQTAKHVPEILYVYDFKHTVFRDAGYTADDVILWNEALHLWDLGCRPQLQININRQEQQDIVTIGMSHILTDGNGFLQYLYLLSSVYHQPQIDTSRTNKRDIAPLLKNIRIQKTAKPSGREKTQPVHPLRNDGDGKHYFCITERISENDFFALRKKSQMERVTLNDVFLTAYGRVIARQKDVDMVSLPCPADLRRFCPAMTDQLSIANMTGIYKKITIPIRPQHSFSDTLLQVHTEMEQQKSHFLCYKGIRPLYFLFHKIPKSLLKKAVDINYHPSPVSYTNIGQIDHRKLYFQNCQIETCYMTGTYRLPPDFQLSISSFRNVCTLNCTLIGTIQDQQTGYNILKLVKEELLDWVK